MVTGTPGLGFLGDLTVGLSIELCDREDLVVRPPTCGVVTILVEAEAVALRLDGFALRLKETSSSSSSVVVSTMVFFSLAGLPLAGLLCLTESGELVEESSVLRTLALVVLGVLFTTFSGDDSEAELAEALGVPRVTLIWGVLTLFNVTTGIAAPALTFGAFFCSGFCFITFSGVSTTDLPLGVPFPLWELVSGVFAKDRVETLLVTCSGVSATSLFPALRADLGELVVAETLAVSLGFTPLASLGDLDSEEADAVNLVFSEATDLGKAFLTFFSIAFPLFLS